MLASRIAFIFLLFCGSLASAADVRYNVLHLQEAYGENLFFTDLSASGTFLSGTIVEGDPRTYRDAFVLVNGTVTALNVPADRGITTGFSEAGVAYGIALDAATRDVTSVFAIKAEGAMTTVYGLAGNGMTLGRQNSAGVVVGGESGVPGLAGFLYSPGTGGELVATLGGVDVLSFDAINDNGWIVGLGVGTTAQGEILADGAVLWIPGQPAIELRRGSDSPVAINNTGQVIGHDGADAWFWDGNTSRIISDIFVRDPANPAIIRDATGLSGAFGINDAGLVTGFSEMRAVPGYDGPMGTAAWIWSVDEGLLFLEDLVASAPGVHLQGGIGIANDGTLLVSGMIDGVPGVQHFLLTPIPEPGAALLLLAACLPTLFRRKR